MSTTRNIQTTSVHDTWKMRITSMQYAAHFKEISHHTSIQQEYANDPKYSNTTRSMYNPGSMHNTNTYNQEYAYFME